MICTTNYPVKISAKAGIQKVLLIKSLNLGFNYLNIGYWNLFEVRDLVIGIFMEGDWCVSIGRLNVATKKEYKKLGGKVARLVKRLSAC